VETTRRYIDKGQPPVFVALEIEGARAWDTVPGAHRAALIELVLKRGAVVVPRGNRAGVAELVDLAGDEEQSYYRVLWLSGNGRPEVCVGFGSVSGCEGTYDCLGVVAVDDLWAAKGIAAMSQWLSKAKARLARFEFDPPSAEVARAALVHGFVEEGRIAGFYGEGADQQILVWRPRS
jgi:hypothetical protein